MTRSIKIGLIGLAILFGFKVNAQTENSKSEIEQITDTNGLFRRNCKWGTRKIKKSISP